jgi:transposase
MSTSLLYHAFGIRGYHYVRTYYVQGTTTLEIEPNHKLCCSACGSEDVIRRGGVARLWRTLPIGGRTTLIHLDVPRVGCNHCGTVRQVNLEFAEPKVRHTKAFARYALELSRFMTIQDVARHLGVSWDTIKDLQKADLRRRFSRPQLKHLRRIAIDEICIGEGHRYLTLVLDLESGAVVFVGEGKSGDSLLPFWRRLRASRARIRAVAMDMSAAYMGAVHDHLPDAAIVFDHFHVIKLMNEKLTELRRDLYREAVDKLHKDVLKGTRWLLLKNPENLDPERDEVRRLHEALRLNQPLATAYYLKEELGQLWAQVDKPAARRFLKSWTTRATNSGIRVLQQMAKTLLVHREGLLNWYDHPISTGPLEGTNNKIRTLQRQAYGFRDQEFFRLKLYALHESKYALVG